MTQLLSRRSVLAGLGAGLAVSTNAALAAPPLDALDFGLDLSSTDEQTASLQTAIDSAFDSVRVLVLPPGDFRVRNLVLRGRMELRGTPGVTTLVAAGSDPIASVVAGDWLQLTDIGFDGRGLGPVSGDRGLLEIPGGANITIRRCGFRDGAANGIALTGAQVSIEDCAFSGLGHSALFSFDGRGVSMRGNRIADCANAGVRIWRSANGLDGSVISGNRIERIGWAGGGNGQNGNGVNVFRADGVIVSDNVIADCAFTAVRINTANNSQVRGNTCLNSGEVAIFSEFGFSGSVIANNIVDGAAGGISITNLDSGGALATCSGNIVRNITPASAVNPDTRPFGIFAEAETAISGNSVDTVPGVGILAGWGPYLRNVAVSGNTVRGCRIGIGVSVAEGAGAVAVTGNIVGDTTEHGIAGMAWTDVASADLVRDAARFPQVSVSGNMVSRG